MKVLRILLAQINPTVGDIEANSRKILSCIDRAERASADLVVFPEMAITGYPPEDLLYKRDFVAASTRALMRIARHCTRTAALVGYPRLAGVHLHNSAAWIERGRIVGSYDKQHLPNYGVFDEKRHFSPGRSTVRMRLADRHAVGLTICEDIWDPSADVYRRDYRDTVSMIINLSASPYHREKVHERERLLSRLSRTSRSSVVYLNLVGGQDELVFDGGSRVYGPDGRRIAALPMFRESLVTVEVPVRVPGRSARSGHVLTSGLRARESEHPAPRPVSGKLSREAEVYEALVCGTRDYVIKNGFKRTVIGMSGGIDSALVAMIAVDAIGADNVLLVTMPSRYTSRGTYRDAIEMARRLGVRCLRLPIGPVLRAYSGTLRPVFSAKPAGSVEENLQARIRGALLMAISNKYGHLVLTTGNKSEMATGYCTLYGDMAGGFAVIKDVAKTLVYRLCRYRNGIGPRALVPASVIKRAPTAELRHGQRDQDTLPPYDQVDRFLEHYVERDGSVETAIRSGLRPAVVRKLARSIDGNEYKRRQAPPGVKISPKAFGRDRRMPITNRYRG
ncbi:MAG: Glutamine-dependent NAD(+) synthetase [Candidatus Omnitrophica bacterium]|nr:Glutamine-dependent NAD(+) synthetase [Candidatus Omnitrophota bacterium]